MILYIIKFSACLAIFMLFYKLFLEKETVHQFKRFYLLATLLISIGIPFITFTTFVEASPTINPVASNTLESVTTNPETETTFSDYLPNILWAIYLLGVLIFTSRFTNNLWQLITRIKQNPKFKKQNFVHVLMTNLVHPHTFLQYIFLNKSKYETQAIPREVILHEETHARQKHALDILFIELMQIAFWFNPLLYFIKRDIKLNHEFLADKAVLNHGVALENYQNTLLAFSSDAEEPQLANAINYSSIKKRFTVMKTHTSTTAKWVKGFIILPILAVLIYSFSTKREVYQPKEPDTLLSKTPQELLPNGSTKKTDSIDNTTKNELKSLLNITNQKGATKEQIAEYNKLATLTSKQITNQGFVKQKNADRLKHLYDLMNTDQKIKSEAYPDFSKLPPPPKNPNGTQTKVLPKIYGRVCDACEFKLPKENLKHLKIETNTGAIITSFKIKFIGRSSIHVKSNKLNSEALESLSKSKIGDHIQLFDLKTAKTRIKTPVIIKLIDKSELPPPPAPPAPPKPNTAVEQPPAPPTPPKLTVGHPTGKAYYDSLKTFNYKSKAINANHPVVESPPSPPTPVSIDATPKSAHDYVKSLKGDDIIYYYNGKKTSYNAILKITKKEPHINISTNIKNGKGKVFFTSVD